MARPPVDKRKLPAAIVAARESLHPTAIAVQGGDARRRFTDDMVETVLIKVATGMSVKQCAEELGISPAAIYQRRFDSAEFAERLDRAYSNRTYALEDTIMEVAYDDRRKAADKKVIIEALQWTMKVNNRAKYGDQVKVDATHSVPTVVLPTIALPSIPDAEFDEIVEATVSLDPRSEDPNAYDEDAKPL